MEAKIYLSIVKILLICCLGIFLSTNVIFAQEEEAEKVPEKLKYYKEKYEEFYTADFETVWNAVQKFIENQQCQILSNKIKQNDAGKQRGICQSDLYVFSQHQGSATFKEIQKYALNPPFIRGGVWTSGRAQYKFIVDEQTDGRVSVLLKTELSGFEDHVTFKAHFFDSNGLLEHQAFEAISKIIK